MEATFSTGRLFVDVLTAARLLVDVELISALVRRRGGRVPSLLLQIDVVCHVDYAGIQQVRER